MHVRASAKLHSSEVVCLFVETFSEEGVENVRVQHL